MKKVLLHITAVLGAAGILICGLLLVPPFYVHYSLGFTETWKTAFAWSWLYLASFSIYFLSVRSLKRLGGRGLWIYGVLCFMAVVWFAYDMFCLSSRLLTLSVLLEFVLMVLLFLPVPLLPVLSSGQKGERGMGVLFFSAFLVFTLSVLTHGYYKMGQGRLANQFDPWQHTDRVLASDAYASHKTGLLITVDEQGRAYAYVSYVPYDGSGVRHTEVFALSREADEIVLTKEFYSHRYQTEPDFSMPFYRGHIEGTGHWGSYEYAVELWPQSNPFWAKTIQIPAIVCTLHITGHSDIGADDPLEGRRPEDWPGVEWDMLDQHFVVGEDRQLSNENGMVLLWTYTDNCFFLAKRQEGTEGVIYEPLVCGRKSPGRDIEDWKVIDPAFEVRPGAFEGFTDYDDQNKGVIWPGEPLEYVRKARLKDGWTEAAVTGAFADTLCLFEKEGQRLLLLHAEAEASLWDDWTPDIDYDNGERLTVGYALFAPDGSLETYGGLVPVAAEQADHLLSLLNTRAKIGSFGYIDWQASWPARTRLTTDGRLVLQNEAGEWNVLSLAEIEQ